PSPQDFAGVDDPIRQERLTKLLDMAFWHNDVGNLDAAVLAAEAALTINPNGATAHSLLGTLYEKKGNDEKAIAHIEAVLELNPNSAADAAKLEMLRRGVRAMATPPPAGFRWIPPALAGTGLGNVMGRVADISERATTTSATSGGGGFSERIASWNLKERKIGGLAMVPMLYSGAAAFAVIVICIVAIRSSSPATATPERLVTVATTPSPVPNSSFADPSRGTVSPFTSQSNALSIARNVPTSPDSLRPPFTVKSLESTPDPFAERLASPAGTKPLTTRRTTTTALPQRPFQQRVASAYGSQPGQLPPLQLRAIPTESNGMLAPAPVSAPPITASLESMPRHTVVVTGLGNGSNSSNNTQNYSAQDNNGGQSPSGATPIIRITVHDGGDSSDSSSVNRSTSSGRSSESGGGDGFQQTALSLQSQGNYRGARAAYEKAIRTYKADIAAGRNAESAQRGLQACQTGLQICQQSE
ncbi:MAG: Photosystem assembly protein Ycf3, partial [Capsulimonas sp.]|nr:Photosystem assembly protein Ycf3 [Capsulimonas sp.]